MRILIICCLLLQGCSAGDFYNSSGPTMQRRAEVLEQGTSEAAVSAVWGQPDATYAFGGAVNGKTLQYGQCAVSRSVTSGVLLVTFIDGGVTSWRSFQC